MNKEYKKIHGIYVPLVTPFYEGRIDITGLKKLIKHTDPHVDGYAPCLSSGEGAALTHTVKNKIISELKKYSKKPIYVGCLSNSYQSIIDDLRKIHLKKVDGIVVPTIYKNDQKNLKGLRAISKAFSVPIIVYNTEQSPLKNYNSYLALNKITNVKAIKDSSLDLKNFKKLVSLRKKGIITYSILQGMENFMGRSQGCDGFLVSLANTEPAFCKKFFYSSQDSTKLKEFWWTQNLGSQWFITIKAILFARGLIRSAEEVNQEVCFK